MKFFAAPLRLLFACGALAVTLTAQPLRLHPLFADSAVLPAGVPLPVSGAAAPGARVELEFAGQRAAAVADASGRWRAVLTPLAISTEGREFTVAAGSEKLVLRDILVGEVWLGSGQSNMGGTPLLEDRNRANDPLLRSFNVAGSHWPEPAPEPVVWMPWRPATSRHLNNVSPMMFHFGEELRRAAPGVPVGIVIAAVGGTGIDNWFPLRDAETDPLLAKISSGRAESIKKFWEQFPREEGRSPLETRATRSAEISKLPRAAGGLYNGMVAPLHDFPFNGVVWYQGEANGGELDTYITRLSTLIERWREGWKNPSLPFIVVQLPNLTALKPGGTAKEPGFAPCREAQRRVAATLPRVGLVVTLDVGTSFDIHPPDKQPMARRAALLARADIRRELPPSEAHAPVPLSWSLRPNGVAQIDFDPALGPLATGRVAGRGPFEALSDKEMKVVQVAGDDGVWHVAEARVQGASLLARFEAVSKPTQVRYAWFADPAGPLLYSKAGIPASTFWLTKEQLRK